MLALRLAQFLPNPDGGPDQSGEFRVSPTVFLVLIGLGFLIGTFGHIIKSKATIAVGVGLIFAATLFVPVILHLTR